MDLAGWLQGYGREVFMKRIDLSIPQFAFVVATRAALGAGIGLLLSRRLPRKRLKTIGLTLLAIGALTTVPAVITIRGSAHRGLWRAA
jgi:hypothetical protein